MVGGHGTRRKVESLRSTARYSGIMHGTACFTSTRVPVQTLLDYIEEGDTLDNFLREFSTVAREQAVQFLELAKIQLIECVSS